MHFSCIWVKFIGSLKSYLSFHRIVFIGIPQGNQLFHPLNLLTDYLKQTAIMEPFKTDCV